ncbi:PqiC family protein [Candidatus Binatus sp.]|uniref:PqiC family protein n=4 Tax=Candidatus Binatus sp. TaxID=2811406 RepID=UPI003C3CC32E
MTLTSFFRIILAGAIAASVSGCSYMAKAILAPQKDISKFYLLTPTADTATATSGTVPAQSSSDNFTLGLGPIKLPPYLDRPEVVTRAAPNRLELSKEDRWGESLQNGFTRAMERDLAAQSGAAVIVFPWYNTVHIDMQVQIDVFRFETDSQGVATLSAKWTILDSTGKNILYTVETHLTQPSKPGDNTDAAAALSRDIGDLSGQIANMIQQLRSHQGTHPA